MTMETRPDTLEDLIVYAEGAKDTLLLIHNELESGNQNQNLVPGVLYSVFTQLTWVCNAMQRQVDKLSGDTLRKIAAEASHEG